MTGTEAGLASAADTGPAGTRLPQILAVVGGASITRADAVDELGPQPRQLTHQQYETVEKWVDKVIDRKLLEAGAAAAGVSVEAFLSQEVESRLVSPDDSAIQQYWQTYQANLDPWGDEVAGQIRRYLEHQQRIQHRAELVARLKRDYPIENFLGPYRAPVSARDSPSRGPDEAPVTIIAFSAFACDACIELASTLDRLTNAYDNRVRLAFRQFPRPSPTETSTPAQASLCAHRQGDFWPMHDALFSTDGKTTVDAMTQHAARLGLDAVEFQRCIESGETLPHIQRDLADATAAGVVNAPMIFINGRPLTGAPPYRRIAQIVDDEIERSKR